MTAVTATPPNNTLEHALAYIALGWGLCSVPQGTKGPSDKNWNSPALVIDTPEKAASICHARPDNGLGVVHAASGTCAIDVDHIEYTAMALAEFGLELEDLFAGAPRIMGKEGRDKAIFRLPASMGARTHKLVWPKPPGAQKPVTLFELRAGPVQDVLPPTIHPDTGNPYRWQPGKAPWDCEIPELPEALVHIWNDWDSFKVQLLAACPWAPTPPARQPRKRRDGPHSNVIGQFNDAHDVIAMLKQHGYRQVGKRFLSPTSESRLPGVVIFEDGTHAYSHHASDPLNDGHAHDAFSVFTMLEHDGDISAAVRAAAELLGLDNLRPDPVPLVDIAPLLEKAQERVKAPDVPAHLLSLPGALGHMVDFYNRTAPKPQPQFAVQAALAAVAVIAGRRYRSVENNWTSLFFINVAKSAAGKEHARTVIDTVLTAAGLENLIGPRGYTSDSGVFSSLYHQPSHISIIDEMGEMMRNAQAIGNFHKRSANTAMMEAWGLAGGTFRSPGRSTLGAPQGQMDSSHHVVHRPSLTVLGMTTPRTFYDNLTEAAIEGGFLNRFIIVESQIGRQLSRRTDPLEVPQELLDWCAIVRAGGAGNLAGFSPGPEQVPVHTEVQFTDEAHELFRRYEAKNNQAMDELEDERLDEMLGRSREKAMRIATGLSVSVNPERPVVTADLAQWGIDYIEFYTQQTLVAIRRYMHGSQFGQWRTSVLDTITSGGTKGRTERELAKNNRTYAGLEPRMRKAVLDSLKGEGMIEFTTSKGPSGRGRSRDAWVAIEIGGEE